MDINEISIIVRKQMDKTLERNKEYIAKTFEDEVRDTKDIAGIYMNLLSNSIELSTFTTLRVLKEIGIDIPGL